MSRSKIVSQREGGTGLYWSLVANLLLVLAVSPAYAAIGEDCAEIELTGAAGFGSQDQVEVRVVDDANSTETISQSCLLTVKANETAVDFLRRIPGLWGDGLGGNEISNPTGCGGRVCSEPDTKIGNACTSDANCDDVGGDGVCGERPKKVCGNLIDNGLRSCKVEARISQKKGKCEGNNVGKGCKANADCGVGGTCPIHSLDNGLRSCAEADAGETCLTKPAVLRVCCRETALCSGKKLDEVEPGKKPITIQTKVNPVPPLPTPGVPCLAPPEFCPMALPDNGEPRTIALDPIGGRSAPYKSRRECRAALQAAAGNLTLTVVNALTECRRRVMNGQIPSGSCATVNGTSDPSGSVATVFAALLGTVDDDCEQSGHSPTDFGYDACPPPCAAIDLAKCTAGMVGNSCARDRDCDTAPAAHDGVCGDWAALGNCVGCQATAAGVSAIDRLYGAVGPGLSSAAQTCQNHIGTAAASFLAVDLKDVAKCQKDVDQFKVLLSERTPKCKDADTKRKRAKARAFVVTDLAAACSNGVLAQLDSCSANLAGLRDCAPRVVQRVTAAVIDAAAPESRCGDGKVGFGEKCDDGNTLDGDGCDSNCTPTGCGNGLLSTGEECDDGNIQPGDGCDPSCHSEPQTCAPQMCTNFTFDCSTLFPGDCVCLQSAEGGGLCVNNFDCTSAQPCSSSVDCSTPGEHCYLQTCCGGPLPGRCGPPTCTGQPQ
jgi:cysteine-rich repeat protein